MNAATFDPPATVAAIGEIVIVLLMVFAAVQIYSSSRNAKNHLANAAALSASTVAGTREAIPSGAPPAGQRGESAGPRAATEASGILEAGDAQQLAARLNEYFAANISQGYAIFWASLLSMIVGFATILAGIDAAGTNSTAAIVAGIAGVFSQFIAATFLVALRSTQQQSTVYAQTLADLRARDLRAAAQARSVALGLRLLDEIAAAGDSPLANQTRAALAMGLIVKDGAASYAAPVADDAPRGEQTSAARVRAASMRFDQTRSSLAEPAPDR